MTASLEFQIREWLLRYIAGEVTLTEFEDWFVPATWGAVVGDDPALADLAGSVELRLAEYTSGHWDAGELREHFVRIAGRRTIPGGPKSGTSTEWVRRAIDLASGLKRVGSTTVAAYA